MSPVMMCNVIDWRRQLEAINRLQAQQRYAEVEALCRRHLANLLTAPAGLVIQVKLQSHLIQSLAAQARYHEAQAQLQSAQATLGDIKAVYSINISLPLELKILSQQGELLRIQGRYAQAAQIFQQTLQRAEEHGLRRQPCWMTLLNDLAIAYKYWGRFDEAENLYQTALVELIQSHGEQHIEVAAIYHNLAGLNHARRHHAEAEPYARKSYQLHVDLLGPQHAKTIADGAALGSILHGLKRWDEAILYFETAIAFFEQQFGPVHYEIAINLNNLAASLQAKGEFEQAKQAYCRALEIKEILLGVNHPDVAISLNNLASLLQQTNQLAKAKGRFKRAISIFEASIGLNHPNTKLCRKNAAGSLSRTRVDQIDRLCTVQI
ncbi:MAG: tetratricopeptide repeat protein [Leptolyngbyaceae cyanobacterium MO_188.B28]|nr:tetratricopeptide repeat protein [Leptolyngbyaceae cyanobacterium MO_188.B28]